MIKSVYNIIGTLQSELEIVAAPRHEVPSRFGTSSRILRASPELLVISWLFAVIFAVLDFMR